MNLSSSVILVIFYDKYMAEGNKITYIYENKQKAHSNQKGKTPCGKQGDKYIVVNSLGVELREVEMF